MRDVRGDGHLERPRAQRRRDVADGHRHRAASARARVARRPGRARRRSRSATLTQRITRRQARGCGRRTARTSTTRRCAALSGQRTLQTLPPLDRRALDQGRRTGAWSSTAGRSNVRGVGLQEDSRTRGFAIDNAARDQQLAWTRDLGATLIRAHYPLHPYTLEQADRLGMLVWSEIPVYQVDTEELAKAQVRDAAVEVLEASVLADRNHPSVLRLVDRQRAERRGPARRRRAYIKRAAETAQGARPDAARRHRVRRLRRRVGCQAEYAPLDVIGINDYFGWYPGPNGSIADRDLLSEYLDTVRACYPDKALMISEFGAEANRDGPIEERGTYAVPAGLHPLPPGRLRDEAVAVGRDLLGAAGVPRAPAVGRRQPAARPRRCTRRASCRSTARRSRASRRCRSSSAPPARSARAGT